MLFCADEDVEDGEEEEDESEDSNADADPTPKPITATDTSTSADVPAPTPALPPLPPSDDETTGEHASAPTAHVPYLSPAHIAALSRLKTSVDAATYSLVVGAISEVCLTLVDHLYAIESDATAEDRSVVQAGTATTVAATGTTSSPAPFALKPLNLGAVTATAGAGGDTGVPVTVASASVPQPAAIGPPAIPKVKLPPLTTDVTSVPIAEPGREESRGLVEETRGGGGRQLPADPFAVPPAISRLLVDVSAPPESASMLFRLRSFNDRLKLLRPFLASTLGATGLSPHSALVCAPAQGGEEEGRREGGGTATPAVAAAGGPPPVRTVRLCVSVCFCACVPVLLSIPEVQACVHTNSLNVYT